MVKLSVDPTLIIINQDCNVGLQLCSPTDAMASDSARSASSHIMVRPVSYAFPPKVVGNVFPFLGKYGDNRQ